LNPGWRLCARPIHGEGLRRVPAAHHPEQEQPAPGASRPWQPHSTLPRLW
jgi:hypothetical protein